MRIRLFATLLLAGTFAFTLSLIRGQESPVPAPSAPRAETPAGSASAAPTAPVPLTPPATQPQQPLRPLRDPEKLNKLQQQMLLTAQRGSQWLYSMNGFKGRFLPGFSPTMNQATEGDNFLHQAGAAHALARAARFCGEERYAVRATQAILSLLDETAPDPRDSRARYTTIPPALTNRLGAAAALVLAINELPAPQKDMLGRSEELCQYVAKQARPDGSLFQGEEASAAELVPHHGMALQALMASHRHRPAAWKVDLVRKALPYYRAWWKKHPDPAFVPAQAAAFAEAYLITKEKPFADFVCEMADWLCGLQYVQIDPKRMLWYGGFMTWNKDQPVRTPPEASNGQYAEALACACRVVRETGDLNRFQRYSEAAERCAQFLATLQYTDAVTQHYQPWFRPRILGAFHATHQDGNLRIDYTQHAVSALFGYLEHVAR